MDEPDYDAETAVRKLVEDHRMRETAARAAVAEADRRGFSHPEGGPRVVKARQGRFYIGV